MTLAVLSLDALTAAADVLSSVDYTRNDILLLYCSHGTRPHPSHAVLAGRTTTVSRLGRRCRVCSSSSFITRPPHTVPRKTPSRLPITDGCVSRARDTTVIDVLVHIPRRLTRRRYMHILYTCVRIYMYARNNNNTNGRAIFFFFWMQKIRPTREYVI